MKQGTKRRKAAGVQDTYTTDDQKQRGKRIAMLLARRLRNFAYWRLLASRFPGGLVSTGTAGRMLGVSRQRIATLIQEGRLLAVVAVPGSMADTDVYIPVDALLAAPTPMEAGQRQRSGYDRVLRMGIGIEPWYLNEDKGDNLPELQNIFPSPGQQEFAF